MCGRDHSKIVSASVMVFHVAWFVVMFRGNMLPLSSVGLNLSQVNSRITMKRKYVNYTGRQKMLDSRKGKLVQTSFGTNFRTNIASVDAQKRVVVSLRFSLITMAAPIPYEGRSERKERFAIQRYLCSETCSC